MLGARDVRWLRGITQMHQHTPSRSTLVMDGLGAAMADSTEL